MSSSACSDSSPIHAKVGRKRGLERPHVDEDEDLPSEGKPNRVVNSLPSFAVRKKPKKKKEVPSESESSSSSEEEQQPKRRRIGRKRAPIGRTRRRQKKTAKAVDSSDSEWASDGTDDYDMARQKNQSIKPKPKPKQPKKGSGHNDNETREERMTEVLFSSQVLKEELQTYMRQQKDSITESEKLHLEKWLSNVQTELQQQNQVVLENIELVTNLRKICRRRNQLQDKLLLQKKTVQATKQETEAMDGQVQAAKQHETQAESANRFLLFLQSLARKTS